MKIKRKKHNEIFSEEEPIQMLHWFIFSIFMTERQGKNKKGYQTVIVTFKIWLMPFILLLILLTLVKNALVEAFDELRLEKLIRQVRINSKKTMYIKIEKE